MAKKKQQPPEVSLEFVDTEDLVSELMRRCDRALLIFFRHPSNQGRDEDGAYKLRWRGLATDAVGLGRYATQRIEQLLNERSEGEDG